jgi:hypothetical protein
VATESIIAAKSANGKQGDARWEARRDTPVQKPSILTIETDCDKLDKCLDKIQGCIGQIEEL